jgi:hypothetical protein
MHIVVAFGHMVVAFKHIVVTFKHVVTAKNMVGHTHQTANVQNSPHVLPHAGTRLVPENFCFIPEQIVLKKEQIVYRFYRLDSGTIALFWKRFDTKFEAI